MPFASERQRRWMHANEPEMAARWEAEEKRQSSRGRAGHRLSDGTDGRDPLLRRAFGPRKRVVVAGSRSDDGSRVRADLDELKRRHGRLQVAEGGARGADAAAAEWAEQARRVRHKQYKADWAGQHRAAGPIRNRKMIDSERPDVVLAYPSGSGRGTQDLVAYARRKGYAVEDRSAGGPLAGLYKSVPLVEIGKARAGYATYTDGRGRRQRTRVGYVDPSAGGGMYRQPGAARAQVSAAARGAGRVLRQAWELLPARAKAAVVAGALTAGARVSGAAVRRVRVARARRVLRRSDAPAAARARALRVVASDRVRRAARQRVSKATLWRGTSAASAKQARRLGTLEGVPGSPHGDIGRGIYTTPQKQDAVNYANPLPNGDRLGRSSASSGTGKRKRTGYVLRIESGRTRPLWEGNKRPGWADRAMVRFFESKGERRGPRGLGRDARPGRGGGASVYQQVTFDPADAGKLRVTRVEPVNRTTGQRIDDRESARWSGVEGFPGRYRLWRDRMESEPARRAAMSPEQRREAVRRKRDLRETAQASGWPWERQRAAVARFERRAGPLHAELG